MFGSRNFRDEARPPPPYRLLLPSLILLYTGFLISFLPKSINAAPQGPALPPSKSDPPLPVSETSTSVSDAAVAPGAVSTSTPSTSASDTVSTSTSDTVSTSPSDTISTSPSDTVSTSPSDAVSISPSDAVSTSSSDAVSTSPTVASILAAPTSAANPLTSTPANLSWVIIVAVVLFFIGFFAFYCVWRTRWKLRSERDYLDPTPSRVAPDTAQTKNNPPAITDLQLGSSTGQMANIHIASPGSSSEEMANLRSSPGSPTEQVANRHSSSSLGSSIEQLTNDEGHQSVFMENTLYGTHAASTSSLDLSTTTNYPYLQQHHFMSSDQ